MPRFGGTWVNGSGEGSTIVTNEDGTPVGSAGTGINVAATSTDEGAKSGTDEEIAPAAAGTRYLGFSARETAGAAAVFSIHNGTGNGDPILDSISLAANESRSEWYGESGIASAGGIWLQRISGSSQVSGRFKVVA